MNSIVTPKIYPSFGLAPVSKRLIANTLILLAGLLVLAEPTPAANQPPFTFTISGLQFTSVAVDPRGNTYLTGNTFGDGHVPITPGAFQTTSGGTRICGADLISIPCNEAFVIKLDPSGGLVYATYLHGSGNDVAYGIAANDRGSAYVTGTTTSPDFPVTSGSAFTEPNSQVRTAGFIVELNPAGTTLVYGTYIPGMSPIAVAIDRLGNAYATGYTNGMAAGVFPVTPGAFQKTLVNSRSITSGVAVKLNGSGSALVYATFLCGSGAPDQSQGDVPQTLAVDADGNVLIAGYTGSPDFPITSGAYQTVLPGSVGAFVSKLNASGSALLFSTYLTASKGPMNVELDSQGGAYVVGNGTVSVTPDAYSSVPQSSFLTHVTATGALQYATDLPYTIGNSTAMDVDPTGDVVLVGTTTTAGLVTTPGAFQSALTGTMNMYVLKFSPSNRLLGATYFGGSGSDLSYHIVANRDGSVTLTGSSTSSDLPGVPPANLQSYAFASNLFPALTIQNAADYTANTVAPGEIVAIRGYGIGPETGVAAQLTAEGSLPTIVSGVSVQFDGFSAPLFYAQSGRINAQVPWEIAGQQSTQLQIQYQSDSGPNQFGVTPFTVSPAAPGVFFVINSDGTLNTLSRPAKRGDYISLYGTGGGLTTPAGVTGGVWQLTSMLPVLASPITVSIEGENAPILFDGAAPYQSSGVFQTNVLLPSDLPAVSTFVIVKVDGIANAPLSVPITLR
jgi:uncharacterized protein (TIGR03437 family)